MISFSFFINIITIFIWLDAILTRPAILILVARVRFLIVRYSEEGDIFHYHFSNPCLNLLDIGKSISIPFFHTTVAFRVLRLSSSLVLFLVANKKGGGKEGAQLSLHICH